MLNVRGLAVLFLLALTGCSVPVAESCEEMSGRQPLDEHNRPEHWGGSRVLRQTTFGENQRVTVVQKPPYRMQVRGPDGHPHWVLCVPQAQSALLVFSQTFDPGTANTVFRFVLSVGAGGQRSEVKIDALNTQQIAVAGENLSVDIMCEKLNPAGLFVPPTVDLTASVTFADGNVSSGEATYTQGFSVGAAGTQVLPIPAMATGFRMLGPGTGATSPFTANVTVSVNGAFAVTMQGNTLSNKDGFIPLSGIAQSLQIDSAVANIQGLIQWGLDL